MQVKKTLTLLLIAISTLLISTSCFLFGKSKKETLGEYNETYSSGLITNSDLKIIGTSNHSGEPSKEESDIRLREKRETKLHAMIPDNTDLGMLETPDHSGKSSEEEVKKRLKERFPHLILDGLEIDIETGIDSTGKVVKAVFINSFSENSVYQPDWVQLTYTTPTKRLRNIITNDNLGEINLSYQSSLQKAIKDRLNELYGIEPEAIKLEIFREEVIIMPDDNYSDYYLADSGGVVLRYTISGANCSQHSDEPTVDLAKIEEAYKILSIDKNTSYKEANKAYKKLAMKYHPDKTSGMPPKERECFENKFKEIKNAWELVKDFLNHN